MPNIEQRIEQAFQLDQQIKSLGKELDPVKKDIKEEMKASGLKTIDTPTASASFNTQERTTMNEEKLVLKLKSLGLTDLIKTVEKPDEEKLEAALALGLLDPSELEACIEVKYVDVLTLKKAKVKK